MNTKLLPSAGLLLFLCAFYPVPAFTAENPARFTAVASWRGTFGKDMSIAGSGPCGMGTVDYSMAHHVNATVALCPFIVSGSFGIWQSDGQRIPNVGTITERQSAGGAAFYTADGNAAQGAFSLTINTIANEYTIQCPNVVATVAYQGLEMEGGASWGPMVTRRLPTNGLVLSGSAIIPLNESGPGVLVNPLCLTGVAAEQFLRDNSVTVSWNLEPTQPEVIVSLEPSHENWIPEANLKNQRNEFEGNSIKITAEFSTECGTGPSVGPEIFRFELVKVSRERGVCMNYPPAGQADTKPDLRFNERLNPANKFIVLNEGTVLETLPGNTERRVTASLSAYDFGAFATLKVTAIIGGITNVGYLKADPARSTNILLPKRQGTSEIADAWKDQHQVRDLADDDDSDNTPVGDEHKGDGFSLYEEYRGFAENQRHIRTNPEVKDLFVRDQIGGAAVKEQIILFRRTSELDVHHKLRPGEMAVDARMNFNHGHAHLHDQHGLYVRGRPEQTGSSEAITRAGFDTNMISTPGTTSRIELDLDEIGLDLRDLNNIRIFRELAVDSLAHELGHGCSVYHHGDSDEPTFLLRQFDPAGNSFLIAADGNNARVVFEDGVTSVTRSYVTVGTNQILVLNTGARQGQHSGNMDCIMRYHGADFFPSQADPQHLFYRFNPEDQHSRTLFCESGAGTKANASAPGKPWPRFGNAADKRGNCKHQLCVNDYYFDDALHRR
ncbi:MAG TPA: hypothetical protein VJW76_13595 [Verrucomicrobiae bacterium]|nr:hypothetical protein [Verrucomicrobiae bacterium]